jgi:hypothetical protein
MKRSLTNTFFSFLPPLFLLSSFCILDSNNKIHNEKFGVKNLPDFNNVFILNFQIWARVMHEVVHKKENVPKLDLKP